MFLNVISEDPKKIATQEDENTYINTIKNQREQIVPFVIRINGKFVLKPFFVSK